MATTAQRIVDSAYKLLGAPFRPWQGGSSPMWLDDGFSEENPPPVEHLMDVGVNCIDLISFALADNGLPIISGSEELQGALVSASAFDPGAPGQPGAVAISPYEPEVGGGRMVLYVGEHQIIQVMPDLGGVTDQWTDQETYSWGGDSAFTIYGLLPGVEYPS